MNCRNPNRNPALTVGLLCNSLVLLLRNALPGLLPTALSELFQGLAVGLLLTGLILCRPERAARLRTWKTAHFHL